MRRLSLRSRLVLITLVLLVVGLAAGSTIVTSRLQDHLETRLDSELRSVGRLLQLSGAPINPDRADANAQQLALGLDLFGSPYFVFLDPAGTVVSEVSSPRIGPDQLPRVEDLRKAPPGGSAVVVTSADGASRWRAIALSRQSGSLIVAGSFAEADSTVARVRRSSLIAGSLTLAALAVAGWFAVNGGLRPLRRIEHTAAAIAGGDLSRRVPDLAAPGTEIGRLSASLNTMLVQLEQAFADRSASEARMRAFVSDVSHELRTPLFGIKGFTELYRMGALSEPADVDATMRRIEQEAGRLAGLTEDLLLLAQLDEAPESLLEPAPMDLRTLANDARHDLRALDPSRPVELTGPGGGPPGPAPVLGDEARLRQVVTNLVGNAVAHTPPGTPVRIGVGTTENRAVLEISDQGPGLTAEQAGRVFDRFYRADRSRSRSGGANAGLGLAIARSLAQAHGGDVELTTAAGKGACFRITLPLAARP
ncbi:two-component sensor histidine kinase [Kribbella sp. ALI-6-A]|uniref:sensor histidine kinase n=1 Tax=Kribbella sp. ALI-6-A TaxID=1933817 RepID=UPI00097C3A60|nr:HAMP domain-containing sensor histidine kinase [Kribbella sp. ALI-6-A]ONI69945.1 two-component sensor histidine kinase [Kribbella sp. ALI-6-A]